MIGKIFPRTLANPSSPLSAWTKPKSVVPIRVSFSFLTHKQVSNICKIYLWTFNKYSRHLRFVFLEKNACVQCIKLNFIFDNKIQMTFLLIANCWYYWHESSLLPILLPLPISEPKHQPIAIPQIYEFCFFLKQKISILPLVVISLSCHFYGLLNPSNFYFYEILSCCSELFIKSCTHLMKGYWPPKIFILWTQCSRSAFWRSEFELLFDCVSWMSSSNGFEAPSP